MDIIIKLIILFAVSIAIIFAFISWYFKFMVEKMIARKLQDIDCLMETGAIDLKQNATIIDKIKLKNNSARNLISAYRRKREVRKLKKLLLFVKQNGFMSDEDKFSYGVAIEDILKDKTENKTVG